MAIQEHASKAVERLEPLLSVADVGTVLGVSRSSAWRLVRDGELEFVRVGSRVLVEQQTVRGFIRTRRRRREGAQI
jgi:excisionase family DNA binding protein